MSHYSYDDFEELELHSTILIDTAGKKRWSRNGGAPFSDLANHWRGPCWNTGTLRALTSAESPRRTR